MTTILIGRQLTLEIDGDSYSAQTAEVTLVPTNNSETYQTLSGPTTIQLPTTWELTVRAFQDWNEAASLAEALVTAATSGDPIPFELVIDSGMTITGNVVPVYPSAGGAADAALEMDLTFPVDGEPTFTPGA
jgi:hypothetical protein